MKRSLYLFLVLSAACNAEPAREVSVTGTCVREVKSDNTRVDIDVDKAVSSGLKMLKAVVDKGSDIYEKSPKKEYSVETSVKVSSGGDSREYSAPFKISVPQVSDEDISGFMDAVTAELPDADEVLKVSADSDIPEDKLRAEHASCAREALADARAKAEEHGAIVRVKSMEEQAEMKDSTLTVKIRASFEIK
ncbi:MAG: hypothetical protein LBT92_03305 [Rickettsiales bacterium]|jgi:hypothetical protein|nr:hypothetical protein [Rickettsiales bacterium]